MYQINNFIFQINNKKNITLPNHMNKFITSNKQYHYTYDLDIVDQIEVTEDKFTLQKYNIKIIQNNQLEKRYLYIPHEYQPYAVYEEINNHHAIIKIHQNYIDYMHIDPLFISLLALERRMNDYHHYILHSAYMHYQNKAILFSAPSGTGKSTQANLWEQYKGSRTINGDRSLIVKENNIYYADGWPVCGSSHICNNEKYPIACIVTLSQGNLNKIERLDYKDCVKKILSELTINYHNSLFVNQAMDFIDDLCQHVPIYHLTCDISENAVKCLENQLIKDGLI